MKDFFTEFSFASLASFAVKWFGIEA